MFGKIKSGIAVMFLFAFCMFIGALFMNRFYELQDEIAKTKKARSELSRFITAEKLDRDININNLGAE